MNRARFNRWVFLLEGLNSVGTAYYFNYLFFFLKTQFGFSNRQNLEVCALNGFVYIFFAYYGGKFGQRHGYLRALKTGCAIMMAGLAGSLLASSSAGTIAWMLVWTVGMCLTWPNLEALAADRLSAAMLSRTIGFYNVVWAGSSALTYFAGGVMAQQFGWKSIFWIPLVVHGAEWLIILRLERPWQEIAEGRSPASLEGALEERHPRGKLFLRLAWIANPFAYIAINAVIPLIPDLALSLKLSPAGAGIFCSIWFFARMLTFVLLAIWTGWHYRMAPLLLSYLGMLGCFAGMLLLEGYWLIVAVQIGFGFCIGVIYYSSLYYSMHVGETKGEHGGVHEAAIGVGIFGGPAVGAVSLMIAPGHRQSSVIGVATVLTIGFVVLLWQRRTGAKARSRLEQSGAKKAGGFGRVGSLVD